MDSIKNPHKKIKGVRYRHLMEKNGAKWAVEIELSPDNILVNVEKDAAACQKIIICVRSEKSKEDYEDRVKASFSGEFIQKVTFEILGNFIPV